MTVERPIIFSGPMVRAILAKRKTQTRRPLRPQPSHYLPEWPPHWDKTIGGVMWGSMRGDHGFCCPYGKPGDRLWVRESFCDARGTAAGRILYRADGDVACRWTPSIHMPRAACRLELEVIGVRVERVQDIGSYDAIAEGIEPSDVGNAYEESIFNIAGFAALWDSINKKRGRGWDTNPWVWAVEFSALRVQ